MAIAKLEEAFEYYIYPTVYIIILTVGVPLNGTLLFMFLRHKNLFTIPNIMVFNLVLADAMNIFANMPLYYLSKYHSDILFLGGHGCRMFVLFRFLNHAVIELSVLALSVQRFLATRSNFKETKFLCRMSRTLSTSLFMLFIWLLGFMLSLPCAITYKFLDGSCFPVSKSNSASKALVIFYFVTFCIAIPTPLIVLNILTSQRLKRSVKLIPGEIRNNNQEETRYRGARVVIALAIAYASTHVPRSIWFFLCSYFELNSHSTITLDCIDEITNYLIFCHSVVNPITLYIASTTFRKLFKQYLFCCLSNNKKHKDLELSPVTSTSSQSNKTTQSTS